MPQLGLGVYTSSRSTRPPATRNRVAGFPPQRESIWFTREHVSDTGVELRATRAKVLMSMLRRRCSPWKASLNALNSARRRAFCAPGTWSAASNAEWCAVRGKWSAAFMAVACHDSIRAISLDLRKHNEQPNSKKTRLHSIRLMSPGHGRLKLVCGGADTLPVFSFGCLFLFYVCVMFLLFNFLRWGASI